MQAGGTTIARPIDEIAEILETRPPDWMVPFLRIAAYAGERAASGMDSVAPASASRRVLVELVSSASGDDPAERIVLIRWRTYGYRHVPPSYAGRLVIRSDAEGSCEVSLDGSYALPDAARGEADAAATARASSVMVSTFLHALREAAEEQARSGV